MSTDDQWEPPPQKHYELISGRLYFTRAEFFSVLTLKSKDCADSLPVCVTVKAGFLSIDLHTTHVSGNVQMVDIYLPWFRA